jgi:hypothetical protein
MGMYTGRMKAIPLFFAVLAVLLVTPSPSEGQSRPSIAHFARTNHNIGAGTISLNRSDTSLDFYTGDATISRQGNISGAILIRRFPSGSTPRAGVSRIVSTNLIHPGSKITGPLRFERSTTYTNSYTANSSTVYTLVKYSADFFLTAGGTRRQPALTSKARADITYVREVTTDEVGATSTNQWVDLNDIYAAIFGPNGVRGLLIISDPKTYY